MIDVQRMTNCIDQGRRRGNRTSLTTALCAQRVMRARRLRVTNPETRQIVGAWHAVIHE